MRIIAPGKLILSGEHAIVHGHPALAMAVDRYVTISLKTQDTALVTLNLIDLKLERDCTIQSLQALKNRIRKDYQAFLHNEISIRDVLKEPVELVQFAVSLLLEDNQLKLTDGFHLDVQSNIPIGCGMGSSAATIIGALYAVAEHLGYDNSADTLLRLGLEAENMQHGFSSGIDLRMSLTGGCVYLENKQAASQARAIPTIPLYIVNTGIPATTTGECVAFTATHFKNSKIGDDFAAVTHAMDRALNTNTQEFMHAIRENHRLLTKIGTVPEKVQQLVREIERAGGAAKICGAGTIAKENAGIVLITHDQGVDALQAIISRYDYTIHPIRGETRGVHVV